MDFEGRITIRTPTSIPIVSYPASFQGVVAQCGHNLRLKDLFGHRASQGRAVEPVLCPSCDMLEILGTLYTAELSAEWIANECMQRLDPDDNLWDRIDHWVQAHPRAADDRQPMTGRAALEVIRLMFDMHDHDSINLALLESKDRIRTVGNLAIDEWEEKWGSSWDLGRVDVRYRRNTDGSFAIKVEVERDLGKECPADDRFRGLPNLGFPQLGSARTSVLRMAERIHGRALPRQTETTSSPRPANELN